MRETANSCARAEDLVAYLYEEATREEARDFEAHARECAFCREELAAFGGVREAIGDWRLQALGGLTHPAIEPKASALFARAETSEPVRASALFALREFFRLSPAWARAATAAFALAFCALAVIAVAHFVERPRALVKEVKSGYSQAEVDAMIAAEVMKRRQESREKEEAAPERTGRPNETTEVAITPRNRRERSRPSSMAADAGRKRQAGAEPAAELAYLPFTAGEEEEELPTLADLLDEAKEE